METFGIFELLDALSAAPAHSDAPAVPAGRAADRLGEYSGFNAPAGGTADGFADDRAYGGRTGSPVSETPAGGAAVGFEGNSGFNTPAGAAANGSGGHSDIGGRADKAAAPSPSGSPAPQALESFLKRHDALSKRADKKK